MAEPNTDELDRTAAVDKPDSRGVALADETPDELPALLAIAVGVAILAITIVWPSISDRATVSGGTGGEVVAAVDGGETDTDGADDTEGEEDAPTDETDEVEEAAPELPDVPLFRTELEAQGLTGLTLSNDGRVVTAEGVVPDEASRDAVLAYLGAQPNVDEVVDGLTIEAPAAAESAVTATAQQVSIVLEGTVPSEEVEQAIVDRAVAVYSVEQVDNQLVVDPAAQPPTRISIAGSMTDPVLFGQVVSAFDGLEGVEVNQDLAITLEESSEVEASLNSLDPIQFNSGSAAITAESEPILDEAAAFLLANPDLAVEIGGHTDSVGGAESNQTLSQARADSVLQALRDRGVENDLTATGFGENRLKINPDENDPEAQAQNRRIEFRII
jgi:outer membrane protein OmpA-like peptidoglycan-associated protein